MTILKRFSTTIIGFLIGLSFSANAEVIDVGNGKHVDRISYTKPININLKAGIEKTIVFQNPIDVGVRQNNFSSIRVNTISNVSYWTLLKSVDRAFRIKVTDRVTKEIFLIDVGSSSDDSKNVPVEILSTRYKSKMPSTNEVASVDVRATARDPYELITRYVAQKYYAPSWKIEPLSGAGKIPTKKMQINSLISGSKFNVQLDSVWRYAGMYLSALVVTNNSPYSVFMNFDPRYKDQYGLLEIRADYLVATPQYFSLPSDGKTLVYVITNSPLVDELFSVARAQ